MQSRIQRLSRDAEVYQAAQNLILEIIDNQWSSHLELMEILKEEAGLFGYASEDPLIDYILEARKLFSHMLYETKKQFFSYVFMRLSQTGMLE